MLLGASLRILRPSRLGSNINSERSIYCLSSSTTKVFDLESESEATRARYGTSVNAMSLLLARRLVEAETPFVTVFWKENEAIKNQCKSAGGWDTHGNNFECLKNHLLPEFDRAFSALIEDLEQRNLLDQTLLIVNSEMGRTPKIGDPRSGGSQRRWTRSLDALPKRTDGRWWNPRRPDLWNQRSIG